MSRPLGLSQQDYEELENPRRPAEPDSEKLDLPLFEKFLLFLAFAIAVLVVGFAFVYAQLCMMVTGRWPR